MMQDTKAKLNKYVKESKKNRDLIKKDSQNLAALNGILQEQEKIFRDKIDKSGG
jgi:hypothetical protein